MARGKQGAEATSSQNGLTLMKLNLPPIIIVVLAVLVCGYVAYLQYAALMKQAQQVQHVADAERMAALLGGRLVALGDQVGQQAKADESLAQLIEAGDRAALTLYEEGLRASFAEAERIRIVLPSDTEPEMSVTPPIGYACLDLARQAEAGTERPPLELHLNGSPAAHLDLVRPIRRNGKVIASLMVSYAPQKIQEWLKGLLLQSGYVELQQGWEGPILGQLGNAGLRTDKPTHRAVISGSSWQLSYWAEEGIGMADAQKAGFLATFGIAALVIALVLFLYSRFIAATIRRELEAMAQFMVESSRGKRFHSYPVKMVEIEQALQMMEPVLHRTKTNDGVKAKAEEGDEGAADIMFMDFGKITVEEEKE